MYLSKKDISEWIASLKAGDEVAVQITRMDGVIVSMTPERTLEGSYFRSDERMTKYFVSNSKGSFERSDFSSDRDTITSAPDTVKAKVRPQTMPQRKSNAPTH